LEREHRPDVILVEPVGSCVDLVATVVQPLLRFYEGKYEIAPYGVILKPSHGRRILGGQANAGFSPKAAYIFRKQLEEADFLIVNRIDQLTGEEVDALCALLDRERTGVPVIRMSARTGCGFEGLLEMLEQQGDFGRRTLELDYDTYAEGEAELGWLNSSMRVRASASFALDDLLLGIINRLRTSLAQANAETAHVKAIGLSAGNHGVANLVSSDSPAELSLPSGCHAETADVIVNARVATAPDVLRQLVQQAVSEACDASGAEVDLRQVQSFRPGRPEPTHRLVGEIDTPGSPGGA
jgi:hypothetical protein